MAGSKSSIIRVAVRNKWNDPVKKEKWYKKLSAVRRKKLSKLYERQNGKCCFCSREMWLQSEATDADNKPKAFMATLDHIQTQNSGGSDSLRNLAAACAACNNDRGSMDFHEFLKLRKDEAVWQAYRKEQSRLKRERKKEAIRRKKLRKQESKISFLVFHLYLLTHYSKHWKKYINTNLENKKDLAA